MSRRRPGQLVGNGRTADLSRIYFNVDIRDQKDMPVCRICKNKCNRIEYLISPCDCLDQNKYVHEQCLLNWICYEVKLHHSRNEGFNNIRCEMCNQILKYKYRTLRKCSCEVMWKSFGERGIPTIIWPILLLIIALGFLIPTSIISLGQLSSSPFYVSGETAQIIVLLVTAVVGVVLLVLLTVFIHQNIMYIQILLEKAYNFDYYISADSRSNPSSADDNPAYPSQFFIVSTMSGAANRDNRTHPT